MTTVITLRARFISLGQVGHIVEILEGPMRYQQIDMLRSLDNATPLTVNAFSYNIHDGYRYWNDPCLTITVFEDWAKTQGLV